MPSSNASLDLQKCHLPRVDTGAHSADTMASVVTSNRWTAVPPFSRFTVCFHLTVQNTMVAWRTLHSWAVEGHWPLMLLLNSFIFCWCPWTFCCFSPSFYSWWLTVLPQLLLWPVWSSSWLSMRDLSPPPLNSYSTPPCTSHTVFFPSNLTRSS